MLTNKQSRFLEEYLVDLNATQAAIRAGYSKGSATVTGSKLLTNPKVREAIDERQKSMSQRLELSAERVLEEIGRIAFGNITDFYTVGKDGNITLNEAAFRDPTKAAAISQIEVRNAPDGTQTIKVRLADKRSALADLAKHLGLFQEPAITPPEPTYEEPEDLQHLAMAMMNLVLDARRLGKSEPPLLLEGGM